MEAFQDEDRPVLFPSVSPFALRRISSFFLSLSLIMLETFFIWARSILFDEANDRCRCLLVGLCVNVHFPFFVPRRPHLLDGKRCDPLFSKLTIESLWVKFTMDDSIVFHILRPHPYV